MTGAEGPGGPDPDREFIPDGTFNDEVDGTFNNEVDDEVEPVLRRSRRPALTVLAILAVLLLVAAVGIFGGIF